mgnify:CR=1 FL=1
MDERHSGDDDLAFDLGYALSRSRLRPKSHMTVEPCIAVAKDIIAHLKRAGWRFTRQMPEKAHSTHDRRNDPCTTVKNEAGSSTSFKSKSS